VLSNASRPYKGENMNDCDFTTDVNVETLASEVTCLKAMLTLMLKAIGQADAGKVMLNMEKFVATLEDPQQAEILRNSLQQIKNAYRQ
jgi:hypothetical protein